MRAKAGTLLLIAAVAVLVAADCPAVAAAGEDEPATAELVITARQGKILRTEADIYRTQVVDDAICGVTLITPRELSVVGRRPGETELRVWLRDASHRPVPLRIRVVAD